jgi:hypothetical protein
MLDHRTKMNLLLLHQGVGISVDEPPLRLGEPTLVDPDNNLDAEISAYLVPELDHLTNF